jgi:Protein of unknown function (DUF3365)
MNASKIGVSAMAGATVVFCALFTSKADPTRVSAQGAAEKSAPADKADGGNRITVVEARERAKLMHDIHASTLEAMHRHYFRAERAVLPARAMDDVFEEIEKKAKVKTRWIAVNTPAMSVDHKPQTKFEKDAVDELSLGKPSFERVEKGAYHRVGVIPLGPGCVACHTRLGSPPSKTPRVAGLVISIPIKDK